MLQNNIEKEVIAVILKVKPNLQDVSGEASFIEDLGFDSMQLVALAAALEKKWNQSLPLPLWLEKNKNRRLTVGSLVSFLKETLK
ncbi:MAG: hypothetical protein HY390_07800 [Deltaproteobacteria bacterium]|nr:hypothetical protein [Deltaproteobacteria bacterium]